MDTTTLNNSNEIIHNLQTRMAIIVGSEPACKERIEENGFISFNTGVGIGGSYMWERGS